MFDVQDLANASQGDIAKRATKKRKAQAVYIAALKNVESLERMLNVEVQWHPESDEYKATLEKIRLRDYMRAVDRLEFLMLQRVFELQKTHSVNTGTRVCHNEALFSRGAGYKMRESIGKNLKSRSKTIGTAVKAYNQAAQALHPPAPPVDFSKLMEWTELQEFDLLRLSRRGDVREREWAKPINREAAVKHHKIKRAREELVRCQVELRRLVTAIRDEEVELERILGEQQQHPLANELASLRRRRVSVNAQHLERIRRLIKTPSMATFARACLVPGLREGATVPPAAASSASASTGASQGATQSSHPVEQEIGDESGDEMDDEQAEQILNVQEFIGHLA